MTTPALFSDLVRGADSLVLSDPGLCLLLFPCPKNTPAPGTEASWPGRK